MLESYHAAGLRIVQLCYNTKNLVGDGASERTDAGLSHFGVRLIKRLNTLGMLVDCSHTGQNTSMEAADVSADPIIISHANAHEVWHCANLIGAPHLARAASKFAPSAAAAC